MLKIIPYKRKTIHDLPDDIKSYILEFVSLQDIINIQLVSRDFNLIVRRNQELWAKHLYFRFIRLDEELDPILSDDINEGRPPIKLEDIHFESMLFARRRINEYFTAQRKLQAFLKELSFGNQECKLFEDILSLMVIPCLPLPSLKKDIHFFQTKSIFQNFLTEIYFGVQDKPSSNDQRYRLIQEICKRMSSLITPASQKTIINIRWYLPDHEILTETHKQYPKMIKMTHEIAKHTSHAAMEKIGLGSKRVPIKRKLSYEHNLREKHTDFHFSDEISYRVNSLESTCIIKRFSSLLEEVIRNHCKITFTYLLSLTELKDFFLEYCRCWKRYVYLTLEYHRIFLPFSDLVNAVYEQNYKHSPSTPKFTMWRLMCKIWISEVLNPLISIIISGFRYLLMKLRIEDNELDLEIAQIIRGGHIDNPDFLISKVLEKPLYHYKDVSERIECKDEIKELLQSVYLAISDLSYHECSIFFSDCNKAEYITPQGSLNYAILKDTCLLYTFANKAYSTLPNRYLEFIKKDQVFIQDFGGKEFAFDVIQIQSEMMIDYLSMLIQKSLDQVNDLILTCQHLDDMEKKTLQMQTIINALHLLKLDEEIKAKIFNDKIFATKFFYHVYRKYGNLNRLFTFVMDCERELKYLMKERNEIKDERRLRGFTIIDTDRDVFFILTKNPTLKEIQTLLGNSFDNINSDPSNKKSIY